MILVSAVRFYGKTSSWQSDLSWSSHFHSVACWLSPASHTWNKTADQFGEWKKMKHTIMLDGCLIALLTHHRKQRIGGTHIKPKFSDISYLLTAHYLPLQGKWLWEKRLSNDISVYNNRIYETARHAAFPFALLAILIRPKKETLEMMACFVTCLKELFWWHHTPFLSQTTINTYVHIRTHTHIQFWSWLFYPKQFTKM